MTPAKHAIAVRIATRFKLIDLMKTKSFTPEEMMETVRHCMIGAALDKKFTYYGLTKPYKAVDAGTVFYMDVGTDLDTPTVYCRISVEGNVALRAFSGRELPETWEPAAHS